MSAHGDASERLRTYRRLAVRNRVVDILRIAVPVIGALVLVRLVGQIYLSSLAGRFGIGQISVSGDSVKIDAPEYTGVLDDGSLYHVSASTALAGIEARDIINLADAALLITRTNGVTTRISAPLAQLDTTREVVSIPGAAEVVESTGTHSVLENSVFDWASQVLTGKGEVNVTYADGTQLVAKGMVYEAKSRLWTFSDAAVTLPATPGAQKP
ncbi:hypothetical protein [uncultured Devosia sp.]|uniref:hypothetical protein n=1 Tax=uncultured Devosia sp. TaxID=211434 RepID=UPI0035CAFB34